MRQALFQRPAATDVQRPVGVAQRLQLCTGLLQFLLAALQCLGTLARTRFQPQVRLQQRIVLCRQPLVEPLNQPQRHGSALQVRVLFAGIGLGSRSALRHGSHLARQRLVHGKDVQPQPAVQKTGEAAGGRGQQGAHAPKVTHLLQKLLVLGPVRCHMARIHTGAAHQRFFVGKVVFGIGQQALKDVAQHRLAHRRRRPLQTVECAAQFIEQVHQAAKLLVQSLLAGGKTLVPDKGVHRQASGAAEKIGGANSSNQRAAAFAGRQAENQKARGWLSRPAPPGCRAAPPAPASACGLAPGESAAAPAGATRAP